LDKAKFQACLAGAGTARVNADIESGRALGVTGTPTFFIGQRQPDGRIKLLDRVSGSISIEQWRRRLANRGKVVGQN